MDILLYKMETAFYILQCFLLTALSKEKPDTLLFKCYERYDRSIECGVPKKMHFAYTVSKMPVFTANSTSSLLTMSDSEKTKFVYCVVT